MSITGHVQNGMIVLDGNQTLPEGAAVIVSFQAPRETKQNGLQQRVAFPLVRSARPGSVDLTGERIAEILNEEDAAS